VNVRIGRALRSRTYRLYFFGQGVSLVGTWLTRFAIPYEAYELSHSTFMLGVVAFFSQMPTSIIAPFAGVLVDRWDRHRTIVVTQIFAMLQSAALAAFALTGTMTVWHLMALGAVQAVINAFDMPARQSFVRQLVTDRADLPNAIALNSSLVNAARLIGPVIAAALVRLVGFGWCFAIDAASYIAVIASLVALNVPKQTVRKREGHVLEDFLEGLHYVNNVPIVRALLISLAITSVLGGAYASMLPAIAEGTLHGGADGLGQLMAAAGAGALVGVLYLAQRESVIGLERVVARCAIGLGIGLVAVEAATSIWIATPIFFVIGAMLIVQWAASNTLAQTLVHDDKMGRVMSLYAVAFFAGAPVGALLEGSLATLIGPVHTFALAGVACLVSAMALQHALPKLIETSRARYQELGLLPAS
jgi:MFS family permease